ncbi:MAG: prolyl oligopeptidase family serine peptidase [Deltaproteobacteria bacterium]|nr:prolyl oligopeptidase family serine peptidase [Deltaproteobacteria bacterium]
MKLTTRWYSPRLNTEVLVARWGHYGLPVLLFPTAGGDAEECERFLMIDALRPLIEAGRIKVFTCDSVAGRIWTDGESSGAFRARIQNAFDGFVAEELVPAIRNDCNDGGIEIVSAGASIGAFNALSAICRHPDLFKAAVCMSGTYDLSRWMQGEHTLDFHYASPLHFLPGLGDGAQLALLRERFVLLATGEGRWEDPGESWRAAHVLGEKGVPNRVDPWGTQYDHDWPTWREMLPRYLAELSA